LSTAISTRCRFPTVCFPPWEHWANFTVAKLTIAELARACKGISRTTLVRALYDLRAKGRLRCLGRGPDAQWERIMG
jgi:hypothetical protein